MAESLHHVHVGDATVAQHDEGHQHVTRESTAPGLLRVVRFDLAQNRWRLDAASRSIGSATRACVCAITDAGTGSLTHSGAASSTRASIFSGSATLTRRRHWNNHAVPIG